MLFCIYVTCKLLKNKNPYVTWVIFYSLFVLFQNLILYNVDIFIKYKIRFIKYKVYLRNNDIDYIKSKFLLTTKQSHKNTIQQ